MTPEDIGDIFQELEDALFAMAIRNMDAHQNWEKDEGFKWTQWQAEQIKGLREYREKVNIMTNKGFDEANEAVKEFLQEAYDGSVDDAAGLAVKAGKGDVRPVFFGVNSDKMNIILDEAVKDIDTKRYACINRMNSGYTDFLRKADIFAQSGSMTIPQALDYAMKDFLAAGLNCVEYSNGNRVNIASYAEMALRTSSSEVTRQANGDVRDALGEHLVVSNVIGMTCPYCQKWQGQVLIDDVYSDGKPDGKYPLVSTAKNDHFLHPNCRHQLFMYIEGITEVADLPDEEETKEKYQAEQKQRYQERQIRKYKRLRDGAVDPADRKKYDARVKEWTEKHDEYLKEHPYLRKNQKRLGIKNFDNNDVSLIVGNKKSDMDQYARYRQVMGDKLAGNSYEEFLNTKYYHSSKYSTMKHNYRVLNQYEMNSGEMIPEKILELDEAAYRSKKVYSTGKAKRQGNIGVMELDGKRKYANSQISDTSSAGYINYKGDKSELVLLPEKKQFETLVIGHDREVDSEAKLFEYAALIAKDGKTHTINLLSERCMCESCIGVMKQFQSAFPNVIINATSTKKSFNYKAKQIFWSKRTS